MATRIIPKDKINGERFGQLLIKALQKSGDIQPFAPSHDPNEERYNGVPEYLIIGRDLSEIENDELEGILQDYLSEGE